MIPSRTIGKAVGRSITPTEPALTGSEEKWASFDAFFEHEYRSVVGLAAVLSGNRAVAEDLAQEAFMAAHRRWDEISGFEAPEAWVRKVVANLSVSWTRRRWREARAVIRLGHRRESHLESREPADDAFWGAVRSLPKRQAQCVALFYFEDRSVADIARTLSIAESTVRVHLHDGRIALAQQLSETVEDDG